MKMKTYPACRLRRIGAATLLLLLGACGQGGDGAEPPPAPQQGRVEGRVVALDGGEPIAGARVLMQQREQSSDAQGAFGFDAVPSTERQLITVQAPGYLDGFAATPVRAGQVSKLRLRLLPAGTEQVVHSLKPNVVTVAGSPVRLELAAGSLVDEQTGAAVTGEVRVTLTPIDPAGDPDAMPGRYTALNGDRIEPIESYGAVKFDLRSMDGRRLDLKPGAIANIRIPLATRSPNPPPTLPLYYFDEARQRWIEDGVATLAGDAAQRWYEGQVSHFTFWNADKAMEVVIFDDCAIDQHGRPWADLLVEASGIDYSGTEQARTDADGRFRVAMKENSRVAVYGRFDDGYSQLVPVSTTQVDIVNSQCSLIIDRDDDGQSPGSSLMPPIIVQQPLDTDVRESGMATVAVTAIGSPHLQYRWQRNGVDIAGADERVLVLDRVPISEDGTLYSVVVSNPYGTATSEQARLSVHADPLPPLILQQPQSIALLAGASASFSVYGGGNPLPTYQWQRNGLDIAGAIADRYTTPPVTLADDGARYTVRLSNHYGEIVSDAATLTVTPAAIAPTIVSQPVDAPVRSGSSAMFVVGVDGTQPFTYRWQRDGVDIEGAQESVYQIAAVDAADDGAKFRVVIDNAGGSVTSEEARLIVLAPSDELTEMRLLNIANAWTQLLQGAASPLQTVDEHRVVLDEVCVAGDVDASLDGSPMTAGSSLPAGHHRLRTLFDGCRTQWGLNFDGLSSLDYEVDADDPDRVRFDAQASNLHTRIGDDEVTVTEALVNGQAHIESVRSEDGGIVWHRQTLRPLADARIDDALNAMAVRFISGSAGLQSREVIATGEPLMLRMEHQAMKLDVDGRDYLLDGHYQFDYNGDGIPHQGSGEILIRSEGELVGRILGTDVGLVVEVIPHAIVGVVPAAHA